MRILFFLRRIGPYHHARFEAMSKGDLIVVETRPDSQEYEWQFKARGKYSIEKLSTSADPEVGIRGSQLKKIIHFLFEKHQPDVVVTTGWADPEYHRVVLEAARRNIPKIVISDSRYEDEPRKFYKEWTKRLILKSYEAAIVAGTASRNYLTQLSYSDRNIFHPWDVVDNHYFGLHNMIHAEFSQREFICVSRFIPKKNLEGLIDAFKEYKEAGGKRKLILLGSGGLEPALRLRVIEYGLSEYVSFKGFAQYEALPGYLHSSFFLILPSWSDQWGLVVNEAMAAGLPVIVSNRCGCAVDLVKNHVNGYIFDPYTQHELADKMSEADALNEVQWKEMHSQAKKEIENWRVSDFADALITASNHAVQYTAKGTCKLLHKFLSR